MPKLTQESLNKRYTCEYCGKSIRSRQGLSGHIQFLHQGTGQTTQPAKEKVLDVDAKFIREKYSHWLRVWQLAEVPESKIELYTGIAGAWPEVRLFLKGMDLTTTVEDFKIHVISSIAAARERRRLEKLLGTAKDDILLSLLAMTEAMRVAKGHS
jgi:hypothetical protein